MFLILESQKQACNNSFVCMKIADTKLTHAKYCEQK